ncbi:hypothetical protein GQ607_011579, partial [Colletotrichum asianum]
ILQRWNHLCLSMLLLKALQLQRKVRGLGYELAEPATTAKGTNIPRIGSKKIRCTGKQPCPKCVQDDIVCEFKAPYARGLSFLLRLQRRLRENSGGSTETSVFALGDPVLPQFDNTAVILPPKEKADNLLKTYFELSSPTYRFLHRPTVEGWLEEVYQNGTVSAPHSRSKYAVIMTMFAQSIQYIEPQGTSNVSNGMLYFQSAERELNRETEPATLTSVQALLGCCFYIMTQSRLNHCWSLFGTTSRLVLALGMHRKKFNLDGIGGSTGCLIESECRKRTFWCAYNLDRYLSAIFGRPCAFHDGDIDQEVTALIEDPALGSTSVDVASRRAMNIMLRPLAHQQLARILSRILRQLYGISSLDETARHETMARLGAEIQTWRDQLPAFLNPDKVDSRILQPIYQRQSNTLSLAAGHCLMLIYRPCLFNDYTKSSHDKETKENVKRCVDAALSVVTIIDYMVESKQLYPSLWFAPYQAFCAVVVLYTYTIRNHKDNQAPWKEHFEAAERCQRLLFSITSPSSLGRRLSVIMEEYRLEVISQVQQTSHSHTSKSMSLSETGIEPGATSWLESIGTEDNLLELMDLPNWEQLDSLVLDLGRIIPELDFMGANVGF